MTTSGHPDIVDLYDGFRIVDVPPTRRRVHGSGEVLILSQGGQG
jgi:hypothetical protein